MATTPEQFLKHLVASRLMTDSEVRAFCITLPTSLQEQSGKSLANELVRRGKLTRYQALRLLEGSWDGLVLGKYVLREKIGEGGMGKVFKAEHVRMKRPVVVKVLSKESMSQLGAVELFQREVEAAAQLAHKNIVTAYDADESDGTHFLVMEHVEGETLGSLLDRIGPFPVDTTIAAVIQAAIGLEYAHTKGIVHRDIKPNNLLLDIEGTVKILDMGLARFDRPFAEQQGDVPTRDSGPASNQIYGTVEYMPPEQVDNPDGVDRRSDIYSLGCTMFRLLTGRPPYQGNSLIETLLAHRKGSIPLPSQFRREVPTEVDQIFVRMVARDPNDRFSTMSELVDALQHILRRSVEDVSPKLAALLKLKGFTRGIYIRNDHVESTDGIDDGKIRDEPTRDIQENATVVLPAPPVSLDSMLQPGILNVGIDLGTTYSAVAWLDNFGHPRTVSNSEGELATPSVILFDDSGTIVGTEAIKALADDSERVADCVKRELGQSLYSKKINGRQYPPEALQAWIVDKLRRDSIRQIGEFSSVVITVPAYFDEVRRKSTQDAGYMAGFDEVDILNEPTAAAIAYGYNKGLLDSQASADFTTRILVYDLGGGTFDVTILQVFQGEFRVVATDGDVNLGGRDWDQRLMDFVAEQFIRTHGVDPRENASSAAKLWRSCEDAKRSLSVRSKVTILCEWAGLSLRVEMTAKLFESLTMDLLERTAFTTRETLRVAELEWDQIDHILLVGGSTRMPAVRRMLRMISGKDPDSSISPDEIVAHGAAIYSGWLNCRRVGKPTPFDITNVNSHSLGVVAADASTKRMQNAIVIPRNTSLPVTAKRVFTTYKVNQKSVVIRIVEGESKSPEDCVQLGKITVRDLPENLPAQTPIEVQFRYGENGRLTLAVSIPGVDSVLQHEIVRENSLTRAHLDSWRQHISGKPRRDNWS